MSSNYDVQYVGDFTIDRILAAFDRIDARANETAERLKKLGTAADAGVRTRRDPQQAELAQQARAAKQAADAEAKAFAAAINQENRQRREAAAIAKALYRDEAAERRRQEAADLKALRDFGNAQRRELRETLRAREQAARAQSAATRGGGSGAASAVGSVLGVDQLTSAILHASLLTKGLSIAWEAVEGAIRGAVGAFASFIELGIRTNAQIESAKLGIATLVASFYDVSTAQGQILQGADKLNAGLSISADLVNQLQVAALQTNATTAELVEIYERALSGFAKAKVPLAETVPLTVKLTQAAQVLGIETAKIGVQIREVVTGNIRNITPLAAGLGITKAMVKEWQSQGTLVDHLNEKLAQFARAGLLNQKTWAGVTSNLEDAEQILARLATGKLFEDFKRAAVILIDGIIDPITGKLTPDIEYLMGFLNDELDRFGGDAVSLAETLVDDVHRLAEFVKENHQLLEQIGANLEAIGEQSAGLVTDWTSIKTTVAVVNAALGGAAFLIALLRDALKIIAAAFQLIGTVYMAEVLTGMHAVAAIMDVLTFRFSAAGDEVRAIGGAWEYVASVMQSISDRFPSGPFANTSAVTSALAGAVGGTGKPITQAKGGFVTSPSAGGFSDEDAKAAKKAAEEAERKRIQGLEFMTKLIREQTREMGENLFGAEKKVYDLDQDRAERIAEAQKLLSNHVLTLGQEKLAESQINKLYDERVKRAREAQEADISEIESRQFTERIKLEGDLAKIKEREAFVEDEALRKQLQAEGLSLESERARGILAEAADERRLRNIQEETERAADAEAAIDAVRAKYDQDGAARMERNLTHAVDQFKEHYKATADEVKAYTDAIITSVAEAAGQALGEQAAAAIQQMVDAQRSAFEQLQGQLSERFDLAGALGAGDTGAISALAKRVQALGLSIEQVGDAIGFAATNLAAFQFQVSALEKLKAGNLLGGVVDSFKAATAEVLLSTQTFTQLGQALGNVLLGNAGAIKEFGKQVLVSLFALLGQISIQLGTMLILVGIGLSSVPFLFGLSGGAAVAAGVALVAFGVAMTALSTVIAGAGQQTGATGTTAAGGTAPTTTAPRKRKIRGGEFETSGESTVRRPGFFGPAGPSDLSIRLQIETNDPILEQLLANGVLTVQNAQKLGAITVDSLNRGSTRRIVRRKLST